MPPPVNPLTRATDKNYGVVILAPLGKVVPGAVLRSDDPRIVALSTPPPPATTVPKHAATHRAGGSDSIKLDDFATPDDNTDLDATTARHGLMSKLDKVKLDSLTPPPAYIYPQPIPCVASVALSSNSLIHIQAAGTAIKADAVLGLRAHAFTRVAANPGDPFDAYQIGSFNGFAVLTPGQQYFLGVNGQITSTAPSSPSVISQAVGTASAADKLALSIELAVELAP